MQKYTSPIAVIFLTLGICTPAQSTEITQPFELVAVYSKIQGINTKYMTGASFTTLADCEKAQTSVQHVVTNIQAQGVFMDGSLLFQCEDLLNKSIELEPKR